MLRRSPCQVITGVRVILLVMINVAQLWILAATVEAALARHYSLLAPLVIASFIIPAQSISLSTG